MVTMPGAVGAVVAARRRRQAEAHGKPPPASDVCKKRSDAAAFEDEKRKALQAVMDKYDTNKSGKLEEDQIRKLLTDIDDDTPPGTPPTDDEIDFVLKVADQAGDNCLALTELEFAMRAWHIFTQNRSSMEEAIAKFDKSGEGTLNPSELKQYLISLNDGLDVTDEEVAWVMEEADLFGDGCIRKPELCMATSAWYCHAERKAEIEREATKELQAQPASACCTIS